MSQPIQYYSPGDCIARIFFTTCQMFLLETAFVDLLVTYIKQLTQ